MSDKLSDDFVLQLANLPGSAPGDGKSGPRRVATAEGAKFYGQPIGTIITPDLIAQVRAKNAANGIKPSKGMLTSGSGNVHKGTPSAANPQGGASTSPQASPSAGGAQNQPTQKGGTSAGNVNTQQGYAAPNIDSTPPDWIDNPPEPAPVPQMALGIQDSSIDGPNKFSVGGTTFNAPDKSRLIKPNSGSDMAIVITPDGEVHFFTAKGEVQADATIKSVMKERFGTKVKPDDTLYSEHPFDATNGIDTMQVGQTLNDKQGNPVFKKTETGFIHNDLGLPVDVKDIKPLFDSGELTTKKPTDPNTIDSFDYGDSTPTEISFAAMSSDEFNNFIDSMDAGEKLYTPSLSFEGKSPDEYKTLTKLDNGNWQVEGSPNAIVPGTLQYVRGNLRTLEPTDLKPFGTVAAEQKKQDDVKNAAQKVKDDLAAAKEAEKAAAQKVIDDNNAKAAADQQAIVDKANAEVAAQKAAEDAKVNSDAAQAVAENAAYANELASKNDFVKKKLQEQTLGEAPGFVSDMHSLPGTQIYDSHTGKTWERVSAKGTWKDISSSTEITSNDLYGNSKYGLILAKNPINGDKTWTPKNAKSANEVGDHPTNLWLDLAPAGAQLSGPSGEFFKTSNHSWVIANNAQTALDLKVEAAKGEVSISNLGEGNPNKLYTGDIINGSADYQKLYDHATPGTTVRMYNPKPSNSESGSSAQHIYYTLSDTGVWNSSNSNSPDTYDLAAVKKQGWEYSVQHVNYGDESAPAPLAPLKSGDTPTEAWLNSTPAGSVFSVPNGPGVKEPFSYFVKNEDGSWTSPGVDASFQSPDFVPYLAAEHYKVEDGLPKKAAAAVSIQERIDLLQKELDNGPSAPASGKTGMNSMTASEKGQWNIKKEAQIAALKAKLNTESKDVPSGHVATYENVLQSPNGTPFHYTKLDGTKTNYVKVDENTILMPGGVTQPIHHWKKSVDNGKVSFADNTTLNLNPDGTTTVGKPVDTPVVTPPEPVASPTGVPSLDKKAFDEHGTELADWEKELLGISTPVKIKTKDGEVTNDWAVLDNLPDGATVQLEDINGDLNTYTMGGGVWDDGYDSYYSSTDLIGIANNGVYIMFDGGSKNQPLNESTINALPNGSVVSVSGLDFLKGRDEFWYNQSGGLDGDNSPHAAADLPYVDSSNGASAVYLVSKPAVADPNAPQDKSVAQVVADIQKPSISIAGVPVSEQQVWEAIDALQNHSHGSPVYGLKSLPDDNPLKIHQSVLIDTAKVEYPKHAPKAAVLALLKTKVVVSNDLMDANQADNPTIHLGKDKPTKNAFGVTGGDFKQSQIEDAIKIIEGYDGKLYKSQLTKNNNALDSLDFNSLVGANKDKLQQKKDVVAHLKSFIDDKKPVEKVTVADISGNKPASKIGSPDWQAISEYDFENLDAGAQVSLDNGDTIWTKHDFMGSASWLDSNGSSLDSQQLEDLAYENNSELYVWSTPDQNTTTDAQEGQLSEDDSYAAPAGTSALLLSKFDNSAFMVTKNSDGTWSDVAGQKFTKVSIGVSAADGHLWLHSTPDAVSTNDNHVITNDEFLNFPIGTVIDNKGGYAFTKTGHNNWADNYGGSKAHVDSEFYFAVKDGYYTLVSKPNEIPGQFVAPAAMQAKVNADGVGPVEQNWHNFAPGLYNSQNSSNVTVQVFADGSAVYLDASNDQGRQKFTAQELNSKFSDTLGNTKYWVNTGIPATPEPQQEKPAAAVKAPSVKITASDIPEGVYYVGNPNNPDTITWSSSDGVITAWNTDGTSSPVSNTKLKNAVLKGQLVNKFGNSKVLPKDHIGTVKFLNEDTNTESLKQLRKALDDSNFSMSLIAAPDVLKNLGVYTDSVHLNQYIYVTQGGTNDTNVKQGLKDAIDGMLGDPANYPFLDYEAKGMENFDWLVGTGKAQFPSYAVGYFQGNNSWATFSASSSKAAIKDIGDNFGGGGIIGQHVSGMTSYQRTQWLKRFQEGDFAGMYNIEVSAAAKQGKSHASGWKHPGYQNSEITNHIKWGPTVAGEKSVDDIVPGNWTPFDGTPISASEINNYIILAGMQNPTHLTMTERRIWVSAHRKKNKWTVNHYSVLAKQRAQGGEAPISIEPEFTDNIIPPKSYSTLFEGNPYPTEAWLQNNTAASDWISDFQGGVASVNGADGTPLSYQKDFFPVLEAVQSENPYGLQSSIKTAAVLRFFESIVENKTALDNKPVFSLAPSQNVKQTNHPVYNVVDQFGKKYIFKDAPADVNGKQYRAEVEAAAGELAVMFGGKAPKIWVTVFQKKVGTMQEEVPNIGTLSGFNWATADKMQTIDLANEHLIDWMLDQDDNWAPNTFIQADGHLVGIDKGRSFINYGAWNGLVHHSGMDVNTHLVYSDLYKAIIDKKISKEVADETWFAAAKRAQKISKMAEGPLLEKLHEATDARSDWSVSYSIDGKKLPNTQQGFFDAFMDRKAKLPAQVEAMWKDIYAKAGYGALPELPTATLGDGHHSGLDDANFHESVLSVGSIGAPTMLAGTDSKHGHALSWTATESNGNNAAFTQVQLASEKQKEVLSWFTANSDSSGLQTDKADPTNFTYDDKFQVYVSAAKTISQHAADGAYNKNTIDSYESAKLAVANDRAFWSTDLTADAEGFVKFPSGANVSFGQVDQYKLMLDYYQSKNSLLDDAKEAKVAVPQMITKFEALPLHDTNTIYLDGVDQKLVKLNNEKWIYSAFGVTAIIDDAKSVQLRDSGNWSAWAADSSVPKAVYSAKLNSKTFDRAGTIKDFNLTLTDSPVHGAPGSEYQVTLPTGEHIYFRNASKTNTMSWQQGSLTFKVPNAKNSDELSAGLERARNWVSENLGVNLEAATQEDAELTYWRQMYPILADRNHTGGTKWASAAAELSTKISSIGADKHTFVEKFGKVASVEEQNKYFRDLWGKHFGADKVAELISSEKYLPRYESPNWKQQDKVHGVPIWDRFDYDVKDLEKQNHMLAAKVMSSTGAYNIVATGSMLSAEQRLRVLGDMMGSDDQSYGGSNAVFSRLYKDNKTSGISLVMHPRAMLRTNTRAFYGTDAFGNPELNSKNVSSDPGKSWIQNVTESVGKSGQAEIDFEGQVSLFGDLELIVFDSAQQLNDAIQLLKSNGIEKIRGVAIEDRLVIRNDMAAAVSKLKKDWYK